MKTSRKRLRNYLVLENAIQAMKLKISKSFIIKAIGKSQKKNRKPFELAVSLTLKKKSEAGKIA